MTKNYGLARFLELHAANETDFQDFVIHGKVKVKNNQTREEVQVSLDALCQNFSEVFEKLYLGQ